MTLLIDHHRDIAGVASLREFPVGLAEIRPCQKTGDKPVAEAFSAFVVASVSERRASSIEPGHSNRSHHRERERQSHQLDTHL